MKRNKTSDLVYREPVMTRRLSFKASVEVKDEAVANELLRKLIDLGFTFESDLAYVSHTCKAVTTYTNINTKELANEDILYSFNFTGGGFNSVWAKSMDEAICKASLEFKGLSIQPGSFKAHRTKASQDAYHKSLPLMD